MGRERSRAPGAARPHTSTRRPAGSTMWSPNGHAGSSAAPARAASATSAVAIQQLTRRGGAARPRPAANWFGRATGLTSLRRGVGSWIFPPPGHRPAQPSSPRRMKAITSLLSGLLWVLLAASVPAEHHRLFVLTGQSNSLGTTNGGEPDVSPGADAADARVRFFWHNVAGADPDDDGATNVQEFQSGTDPLVADQGPDVTLPVFLLTGGGNARGTPAATTLHPLPPGHHPAEQPGGPWFHDGSGWTTLAAAADGSFGPEIAFARLLWDAGWRAFGIVKSTTTGGGNSLWDKGGPDDSAYQNLAATATAAAASPPPGIDGIEFRALLCVQGEHNDAAEADAADTRFADLLENLRGDLPNAAAMHGILGEIAGAGADRDTTRARHAALAAARPDVGLARATGLAVHNEDGLAIHYDADGLFVLGARLAAEALAMAPAESRPLPAWEYLHAWYVADHAAGFDAAGAVARWGAVHDGAAVRDLARRVAGQVFRTAVTANGAPREVLCFDGTNDLWANATSEFGTLPGPRSVAVLCRLTGAADGFLFDGSTYSGRTRAQVRAGSWQAGVTPASTSVAWNLAEPDTAAASPGWQRHVFTFTADAGNTATTVAHWIDGTLATTVADDDVAALGGLIVGSNGGAPFTRLPVEVAEVAVFSKALDAAEVAALDARWAAAWGTPIGPPFSARVTQVPRTVPRFGSHAVIEIPVTAETDGAVTLESMALTLRQGAPGTVSAWRIHAGAPFNPSSTPLAETGGDTAHWAPALGLPLAAGTNRLWLTAVPARHAPLGSTIDAAVDSLTVSGAHSGTVVPAPNDPAGELSLALVPLIVDVRTGGEGGVATYRIPGIACDSAGVLHAVYDHRYAGGSDLPADIDVGYARSTDGGATWSASQVILDFDAAVPGSLGNGVGDPCILHDPVTDTLWVAALWSCGDNGYNGSGPGTDPADTGQYVLTKSTDGGLTWSAPINVTTAVKDDPNWRLIFQGPGHGLALRDGTLVFPSQYRDPSGVARSCSVFSADHGATWDFGSGVPDSSPQTNEATACELDDGRLLFSMRTPAGSNGQRAWIHYTPAGAQPLRDGSWGALFRLPAVPDPVCQGSVIQWTSTHRGHPREFVVFGNPASSSSRVNYTLRVSPDGGATWPVARLLYPASSAYSSLCILPDKSVGVLLERDNYSRITFLRVEEGWLLNHDLDTDGDGIPDAWESLHGLLPADPSDAALDPDGDHASNLAEFLAGTNPLDPASRFAVSRIAAGDEIEIDWSSVPGRSYTLEESPDLHAWSPVDPTPILATTPAMSAAIPDNASPTRFFRIRTSP